METQARVLWDALVFRTPVMLRIVEGLSDERLQWLPPNGVNSIAWLLWHIAEVEDNWMGSSRVDLQACKLEYSIVSPK